MSEATWHRSRRPLSGTARTTCSTGSSGGHPTLRTTCSPPTTVYAKTGPSEGARGISTFLVDCPSPGVRVHQPRETVAYSSFLGRVCDLEFDNVRVPAAQRLGEEGRGFLYVQDQLNRNRTVIATDSVGIAQRCLDDAIAYAKQRTTFGSRLADRQAIQWMIAESKTEIEMGRALAYKAAWMLDQDLDARTEVAMAKSCCPEMAARVIDRSIQILGASACSSNPAWAGVLAGAVEQDRRRAHRYDEDRRREGGAAMTTRRVAQVEGYHGTQLWA